MKVSYTERKNSIITDKGNIERLYEFNNFPVFIGCTDKDYKDDLYADMIWDICVDSGMIQLHNLLSADIVYSSYHSEAVGGIWKEHHNEFSRFIYNFHPKDVLEIGGSNGNLAINYLEIQNNIRSWTIIEPNPSIKSNKKIKVLKGFFGKDTVVNGIDTIVISHVLEHIYDPNSFLQNINRHIEIGQYLILSIPNLHVYLQKKFSNSINFEHTYFLTEYFCNFLLLKHGFEIEKKSYFRDHSIFLAAKKTNIEQTPETVNHYIENKRMYLGMVNYYTEETKRLNSLIDQFPGKIFLFGAHIFSQFLIYLGLNSRKISNIIDNSELKNGKRLYGTELYVRKPDVINMHDSVAVILKAGQYQKEVKNQLSLLKKDVVIWE